MPSAQLLQLVQADKALQLMWRESRVSRMTWDRDLLPALHGYAELVQLMPASESHHHAHVGGLLAHTIEMMLAAMTWRNGHFLPEGASVEVIDAQRDVWTYVVFFGALLHDVGKIMCDLRITWKSAGMVDTLDWSAIAGPLTQVCAHLANPQYLVQFTPKASRDYQAHSRLALLLLQRVAPASSMTFLARHPAALTALSDYLSGQDRTSLVAKLVARADQASTVRALKDGSRARFTTSTSVPLVDLLMSALRDLLKSGSGLPLNRSGAAGWVYDGSLWLVAKRVADSVRKHLAERAPNESVPGENKNDRLFDTWQEYGCILPNPATGQAIWYVSVQGGALPSSGDSPAQPAYTHELSMLRFALDKVYGDSSVFPPAMNGRLEVRTSRGGEKAAPLPAEQENLGADQAVEVGRAVVAPPAGATGVIAGPDVTVEALPAVALPAGASAKDAAAGPQRPGGSDVVAARATSARTPPGDTASRKPSEAGGVRAPLIGQPKPKASPVQSQPAPTARGTTTTRQECPAKGPGTAHTAPSGSTGYIATRVESSAPQPPISPAPGTSHSAPPAPSQAAESAARTAPALSPSGPTDADDCLPSVHAVEMGRRSPKLSRQEPLPQAPRQAPAAMSREVVRDALPPVDVQAPTSPSVTSPPVPPDPHASPAEHVRPPAQAPAINRLITQAPDESVRLDFSTGSLPVVLTPFLPPLPHQQKAAPPPRVATEFSQWLQQGLGSGELPYNEAGAMVHFVAEGMALVSPAIFKAYAEARLAGQDPAAAALQVQREVVKASWHLVGPGKVNILSYDVLGRGAQPVSKLSVVVFTRPDRWVVPVPPANPVLRRRSAAPE